MTRESPVWNIGREGRAWKGDEAIPRYDLVPRKTELIDGKLFWRDEQRLTVLALLLENVGIDAAVSLGDIRLWREAIESRERELKLKK